MQTPIYIAFRSTGLNQIFSLGKWSYSISTNNNARCEKP